jgi:hypothetical protein
LLFERKATGMFPGAEFPGIPDSNYTWRALSSIITPYVLNTSGIPEETLGGDFSPPNI